MLKIQKSWINQRQRYEKALQALSFWQNNLYSGKSGGSNRIKQDPHKTQF